MGICSGMVGRRWRMRGLSKRKGSDNWQGRFRIPESLWRCRVDLAALDVRDLGKSQEFTKSLGTGDRQEATSRYRLALDAWDRKMEAWQTLLDEGPTTLTHQQSVALAGAIYRRWATPGVNWR